MLFMLLGLASAPALAGFDHEWALDQNGIWGPGTIKPAWNTASSPRN
jgi:hypothetical protein